MTRRQPYIGNPIPLTGSVRTCAACRVRHPRHELLRFVFLQDEKRVVLDLARQMPGRGLNLGPSPHCLRRAAKHGAFQRLWRHHLSSEDLEVLILSVRHQVTEALLHYLRSFFSWNPEEAQDHPTICALLEDFDAETSLEQLFEWLDEQPPGEPVLQEPLPDGPLGNLKVKRTIAFLSKVVSQFTFNEVGAIKRPRHPLMACQVLANPKRETIGA